VILTTQHGEEEFQVKLGDPVMLTVRQLLGCDESKEVAITFGTDAVDSDAETFYDLGAQDGARLSVVEAIAFYQHNWSFQRTRTEYAPEYRQIESGHYTVLHKGVPVANAFRWEHREGYGNIDKLFVNRLNVRLKGDVLWVEGRQDKLNESYDGREETKAVPVEVQIGVWPDILSSGFVPTPGDALPC